jgi:nitroreductase
MSEHVDEQAGKHAVIRALNQRRSVRRYTERAVPRAQLLSLLDAAIQAPSNFNRQPWQFVVLDERDWIDALYQLLERGVAAVEARDTTGRLYNLLDHVRAWLYPITSSAAIILSFYKPSPERVDEEISSVLESGAIDRYNPNLIALGMAIENLLLAAHAQGLGACMHSGPLPFLRGALNRLLGLPERLELAGLITLGWPGEAPERPRRRPLEKTVQFCSGVVPDTWRHVWA